MSSEPTVAAAAPAASSPTPAAEVTSAPAAEPTTAPAAPPAVEAAPVASTVEPTPASTAKSQEVDEPEPQNELTKKFTEQEWAALKQFRAALPEVFKTAFRDKEKYTLAPIVLWTVTIDPSGAKDAKASVVLMKFLRARNLNVEAAKEAMIATLRWRDEFDIDKAMNEEFPQEVFGDLGHIYAHDKQKRPVTYNLYGRMSDVKTVFGDKQRFIRWRIKLMEEGIKLLDFETVDQIIQVHDYEGVKWNSRDANSKAAASEISSIFSAHYPEMLASKFFVNVPTAMTWIFWLFRPLLPAATLAKMKVAGHGPHSIGKELLPLIDAKQLPKQYGGEAKAPFTPS
ncbi:CRAL/TRIO domain-containing protein [Vararia minispora EC-137]|uniref:CRAL/TRIO domain-containing protein n=1 Tax=Vararia minispora EC-137 TaxID=1314806 RepID=A0ACB8QTY4_9AGAM|nr:CRAL/TRIO domain-containing protein [Vararia minispora EC-137]